MNDDAKRGEPRACSPGAAAKAGAAALLVGGVIAFTLVRPPVRLIHPDALHFMGIFQEVYGTVHGWREAPAAFWEALQRVNAYDLSRGRLVNYLLFGLEAAIRSRLPFPFVSWLTLGVLLLNAGLLARLVTRHVEPAERRQTMACLAFALAALDPMTFYAYEMQFTYAKYTCVTFVLLFLLSRAAVARAVALVGAAFSDEIGLVMVMAVLAAGTFNHVRRRAGSERPALALGGALALGALAALAALVAYHAILGGLFGEMPWVIRKGGFDTPHEPFARELGHSFAYAFATFQSILTTPGTLLFAALLGAGAWKAAARERPGGVVGLARGAWQALVTDPAVQLQVGALCVAFFVVLAMYRGVGVQYYYPYPIAVILTFTFLSFVIARCQPAVGVAVVLATLGCLVLRLPETFRSMREHAVAVWLPDGAVTLEAFERIDTAVTDARRGEYGPFRAVNNHQELDLDGGYVYTARYFPVQGMVRVLVWPDDGPFR
ncbi:hypothetical protein [Anaeromyxobacter paludicola]|uniref:Glycosyltransferase RgtA/B/C/D-like domain-containing protein n=1 Tax=Anaeromyxobacter paludicola TaxID=2918171 RepID=A0ABN6N8T4_9BACT|nr:hypothetical protein [Anaeromyxobacter paludicola]BDG09656.1 hypothetical protein AMPC_27690 [Anaeromyxobacter paludicola]